MAATVKNSKELVEKVRNFISSISEDGKFRDEQDKIVSLIVSSVDEEETTISCVASPLGVAMTIFRLFENLRTKQEQQAILLKLIAIERGIEDLPQPPIPSAKA